MSLHNIALTVNCLFVAYMKCDVLHLRGKMYAMGLEISRYVSRFVDYFAWAQGPTSYRPKFATTLCKELSRHLSSCLWQEHSSDIVEGYEFHRCIYDHLDSGTRLLFDCDRVIFCFWQAEKHFSMELQSDAFRAYWWKDCFHLRLAPLFQISVHFMHTWGSRCTWVHNTWNTFDLPSRHGIELYAAPTRLACLLLAIAPAPLRDTTGEAVSGADAEQPTATFLDKQCCWCNSDLEEAQISELFARVCSAIANSMSSSGLAKTKRQGSGDQMVYSNPDDLEIKGETLLSCHCHKHARCHYLLMLWQEYCFTAGGHFCAGSPSWASRRFRRL